MRASLAVAGLLALARASAAEPLDDGSTCVSCHLEEEADVPDRKTLEVGEALRLELELAAPTREWSESVHAAHDVSCDGCHGGDPREPDADLSMSEEAGFLENPSWLEMGEFCGVCHEQAAASYRGGAFGRAMDEGRRVATCATCHMADGHRIVASAPEELLATRRCSSCPPVEEARELVQELAQLRALQRELAARVGSVEARGLELADVALELVQLRAGLSNAVHAFEPGTLRAASRAALSRYRALEALLGGVEEQLRSRRRYGFVLIGSLALLFAALLGWERMQRGPR